MNTDPDFDHSADMRLLELQRASLGLAPPQRTAWQSRMAAETAAASIDEPLPPPGRSAVLAVQTAATPASGVIPGAVVTVTLSIANEGAVSAAGITAMVPIPGGAGFRPGSFMQDGRALGEDLADRFFHDGIVIDEIPPGGRSTFVWKLGVRLGAEPLLIVPVVRAGGAAIVGARTLSIPRREKSMAAFAAELERTDPALYSPQPLIPVEIPADELPSNELPFYELDDEETLIHEAADAALSTAAPRFEPEAPAAELLPEPEAIAVPEFIAEPEPEPEPEPAPAREAVVLYGRFDRATIAFFERTFNGSKAPTLLSHCIFGSALACATGVAGDDTFGLKRHLDAQSQLLHRMQLHERLGKKEPIAEYAGDLLATLDGVAPAAIETPEAPKDAVLLETELSEPTLGVLAKIHEDRERWDFVKARQLTLALQAQRVAGIASDSAAGAALENALRVYAQTAMTTLQKLFVRLRIDRTTGVLFQNEPQLDAAARAVVSAFGHAIAE